MNKSVLARVIQDQAKQRLPTPMVPRWHYQQLAPLTHTSQVIILSGIRRCGKSTLMQYLRSQHSDADYHINFDDNRLVQFKLEHFDQLLEVFVQLYGVQQIMVTV